MKMKSLPLTVFVIGLLTTTNSFSQSKKFFAVTGEQLGSVNWITFREANLDENSSIKTLYTPAEKNEVDYDALSGSKIYSSNTASLSTAQACGCLNTRMVAAIAYDGKNNRLYYTQMLGNQLRYLDLNEVQPKSYVVTNHLLKNFKNLDGEASVITKMCMASDNYGYAITNDNEHLIRFSTDKQSTITDLGKLVDAKSNGENSVKTQIKSWGGDLVADVSGNLYMFTMQRGIYKINSNTRLATYLGQIKNIPEDYTINAAMVDQGNKVIVGSSTKTTNYYRVNLSTLEASIINNKDGEVYNVSDFANANLAFDKNANDDANNSAVAKTLVRAVNIYPNPVSDKRINVQLNNFTSGKYKIQLSELQGKTILEKEVNVSGSQTESMYVSTVSAGAYLIRVVNEKGENVYVDKVIISR